MPAQKTRAKQNIRYETIRFKKIVVGHIFDRWDKDFIDRKAEKILEEYKRKLQILGTIAYVHGDDICKLRDGNELRRKLVNGNLLVLTYRFVVTKETFTSID